MCRSLGNNNCQFPPQGGFYTQESLVRVVVTYLENGLLGLDKVSRSKELFARDGRSFAKIGGMIGDWSAQGHNSDPCAQPSWATRRGWLAIGSGGLDKANMTNGI